MSGMYDDDIRKRLRRIEGQVRGVLNMIEQEALCKEVVTQLSAIRSAVDRSIACIVAANLEQCLLEQEPGSKERSRLVQEAVELLIKSR